LKTKPSTRSPIGLSIPRADTRRLVAGRGRYVDDYSAKGELHAAFLRSPFPHAEFTLGDLSRPRWVKKFEAVEEVVPRSPRRAVCRDRNDAAAHRDLPIFVFDCSQSHLQKQAQFKVGAFEPQPSVYQN